MEELTIGEKRIKFNDFCHYKDWTNSIAENASTFFKVSVPAVRKWTLNNGNIPNYVIAMIDKEYKIKELEKTIDTQDEELEDIKEIIKSYFKYEKRLKALIK